MLAPAGAASVYSPLHMGATGGHEGFFRLLSGERRGLGPAVLRGLLWLAALPYGGFMAARRLWYRVAAVRGGMPVVSVGNLTVGGTGKTPLAAAVARRLAAMGRRPVVVSRGYKRPGDAPGDEAADLQRTLPAGAAHAESADRVAAVRQAAATGAHDVAVLDVGFQHLRLRRELDIVTVDATRPFGYGHLLPRGLLREPLGALRRAGAVVLTRSDQVSAEALARTEARVRQHLRPGAAVVHAMHVATRLVAPDGASESPEVLRGTRVLAFCGLGNPAAFHRTLADLGAVVVATRDYADHHAYGAADVADIAGAAAAAGAERIVTTTKDFVKAASGDLLEAWPAGMHPAAVEIEMRFREGASALDDLLRAAVGAGGASAGENHGGEASDENP